ncbi:MAG: Co-chaperone protein DjlA [Candidatus Scalindua arabica]|uniref:Co-chaperone protein DjlA n=1 Tax=Candidatus Scalindua arabica TaxID=1127984 RepID=A0A942A2E6_9BACT|nr:Co-chaperone protein DjlA [Candidatus Scalindua arabica]
MKWKGKAIGAGLGFLFGGPFGAILGAVSGDFFDKATPGTGRPVSNQDRSLNFVTHLVGILISIAKADGRLSTQEINVIDRAFVSFGFRGEDLSFIRDLIQHTSRADLDLQAVCYEYKQYSDYEERLSLLRIVYMVAFADKEFHANEESMINRIIGYLEINAEDAFEIRGEFCSDNDKHYKILSVTRDASAEDVKKAYRHLSKKYHPDRVSHLGEEFATLASDKFRKINNAYEEIKKEKRF